MRTTRLPTVHVVAAHPREHTDSLDILTPPKYTPPKGPGTREKSPLDRQIPVKTLPSHNLVGGQ